MTRWHVPFDHIETSWTDAQFTVMVQAARRNEESKTGKPDRMQNARPIVLP